MMAWLRSNAWLVDLLKSPERLLSNGKWRQTWDQRWFRQRRAQYCDYLSALLTGLQGSRTLRDVFADDVLRYGNSHPRGRLAAVWMQRYAASGGSLFDTWRDCLPKGELAAISAAQELGNATLRQALSELARIVRLDNETRQYVRMTLTAAWGALFVLIMVLAAMPAYSVPSLMNTFSSVPTEYYGSATQRLIVLSAFLQRYWWSAVVLLLLGLQIMHWSLHAYCGRLRPLLDRLPPWSLYRRRYTLSFMSMLQLALQTQDNSRVQLRQALGRQRLHANTWVDTHVRNMLARLDSGAVGANVFDTGLLDREHLWFLDDMVKARGMGTGIALTAARLEQSLIWQIRRQAVLLRWVLLLGCVAGVLGSLLWHYVVIDEFRSVLTLLHSM